MQALICGRYKAGLADGAAEVDAALALRGMVFRGGADDRDAFDRLCDHIIVRDVSNDQIIACARVMVLSSGAEIQMSYAAQSYDLERLSIYSDPMAELGRFCLHPDHPDAEVLRVIWGALTQLVDTRGVRFLFGCASFPGANVAGREAALRYLADHHLAPDQYAPGVVAPQVIALAGLQRGAQALRDIPPLLRAYLSMGAWVSDHAVLDEDLDTLHVFTGLEISTIPEPRKRLLRMLAGS